MKPKKQNEHFGHPLRLRWGRIPVPVGLQTSEADRERIRRREGPVEAREHGTARGESRITLRCICEDFYELNHRGGIMRKTQVVHVGKIRAEVKYEYVAFGIAFVILGCVLLYYQTSFDKDDFPRILCILLGMGLMISGIAGIAYGFYYSTNTMYLKNNHCSIIDRKVACGGGCKNCNIALVYILSIEKDDSVFENILESED